MIFLRSGRPTGLPIITRSAMGVGMVCHTQQPVPFPNKAILVDYLYYSQSKLLIILTGTPNLSRHCYCTDHLLAAKVTGYRLEDITFVDSSSLKGENKSMKVIYQKSKIVLGKNVVEAISFWEWLRGYMFYQTPPSAFDGIYFRNCNMVHNSFARFSLEVIFIDKANSVVKIICGFHPWKFSSIYFNAAHAIEFPIGTVPEMVSVGDKIVFEILNEQ